MIGFMTRLSDDVIYIFMLKEILFHFISLTYDNIKLRDNVKGLKVQHYLNESIYVILKWLYTLFQVEQDSVVLIHPK